MMALSARCSNFAGELNKRVDHAPSATLQAGLRRTIGSPAAVITQRRCTARRTALVVHSSASDTPLSAAPPPPPPPPALSADEQKLAKDARTTKGLFWISFWGQLALSCVSGVILVFSITVREGGVPPPSTWLALAGVATAFVSTFFAWTCRKMAIMLANIGGGGKATPRDLIKRLEAGSQLNLVGMGATILALQAEVGTLLSKTLTSSSANPYAARDTPVAFDVFTVQASTNVILAHFVSILFTSWALRIIQRRVRIMAEAAA